MKKTVLSLIVSGLLLSLSAEMKLAHSDLEYDKAKGWWWYEETYIDKDNKEEKIRYSMTPKEKKEMEDKKKLNELLVEILAEQKENKKINADILYRLNYAFPDVTPKYTINKKTGEKCLTNSSMDCFVMPVVAEAQQVPVLNNFISAPSPENSKNWLQWQATYFNHVKKISHGLRFAYLKHGADAYPTSTRYARGDNPLFSKSELMESNREAKIVHSLKDRIALLNFVGKNVFFEKNQKVRNQVHNWNKSYLKDINSVFIFETEKDKNDFLKDVSENQVGSTLEFWKNAKITVRPDLYKAHNIKMTPSTVMYYEDKEKKINISETITSGTLSSNAIRNQIINFLTYNEIIEEKELAAEFNWASSEPESEFPMPKPSSENIYKDYTGDLK